MHEQIEQHWCFLFGIIVCWRRWCYEVFVDQQPTTFEMFKPNLPAYANKPTFRKKIKYKTLLKEVLHLQCPINSQSGHYCTSLLKTVLKWWLSKLDAVTDVSLLMNHTKCCFVRKLELRNGLRAISSFFIDLLVIRPFKKNKNYKNI